MPLSVSYVGDGVVGDDVGSVGGGVVGTASVAAAASGEKSEKESVIVLVTKLAFATALRQMGLPYRGCPLCC